MAFPAQVFRVLIASPIGFEEEREIEDHPRVE